MDNFSERRKATEVRQEEYDLLQRQFKKARRDVFIGSCVACLIIGFMAGFYFAYPRDSNGGVQAM